MFSNGKKSLVINEIKKLSCKIMRIPPRLGGGIFEIISSFFLLLLSEPGLHGHTMRQIQDLLSGIQDALPDSQVPYVHPDRNEQ